MFPAPLIPDTVQNFWSRRKKNALLVMLYIKRCVGLRWLPKEAEKTNPHRSETFLWHSRIRSLGNAFADLIADTFADPVTQMMVSPTLFDVLTDYRRYLSQTLSPIWFCYESREGQSTPIWNLRRRSRIRDAFADLTKAVSPTLTPMVSPMLSQIISRPWKPRNTSDRNVFADPIADSLADPIADVLADAFADNTMNCSIWHHRRF